MDWQLTCRVCLETGDMVSLFDWDENNEQLADKYAFCCGVEVDKNDTLPTLICLGCVDKLTESYQFKQQCISSIETLKECLEEFVKSAGEAVEQSNATELITIKNEDGGLVQYELPIENVPYTRTISKKSNREVVSKAPPPMKRGRPRKYPDTGGSIKPSPYNRKHPRPQNKQAQSITELIEGATFKEEPEDHEDEEEGASDIDDPDFAPMDDDDGTAAPDADDYDLEPGEGDMPPPKKRGRPRKHRPIQEKKEPKDDGVMDAEAEDMLLQETILAMSEPIPEHVMNPKPKKPRAKQPSNKKKYNYDKIHICETCGASFSSNSSLQAHIRRHLGIKPFVCSICGYSCVLSMELKRHMYRHTGVKPFQCRICERRFADFGSRQKHESECGFAAVAAEALKRHMFRHTGEKPYKCRMCERAFTDYGTRQKHERLHMGLRPYTCSVCGKAFTYSYVLANHMLIHTGEKKYQCAPCNRKFTKAHHLKYHNKVHHKDLYQAMLEEAAKKKNKQQNQRIAGLFTGHIVDGKLQIVGDPNDDNDNEGMMQVVEIAQDQDIEEEECEDNDEGETHRAVASMQAVELSGEEYIM